MTASAVFLFGGDYLNYVTPEEIEEAKRMDLLTYLKNYEPDNLIRISRDTYCTSEHDSLKISNGKWNWFSRGFGGYTALDYLVKVKDYSFPQAVMMILGRTRNQSPIYSSQEAEKQKRLLLPKRSNSTDHVVQYLRGRGIHPTVIDYCLKKNLLYESADKYKNAVFLSYDISGNIRSAAIRSTITPYKGDAAGSDKHCSFSIFGRSDNGELHIFESAIDLLSYASLLHMKGEDWRENSLLSLAGVYKQGRANVVPVALDQYLRDHPDVQRIHIHLDNDDVGRGAAVSIKAGLEDRGYSVFDEPPTYGKDVNDQLMARVGLKTNKEEFVR